MSIYAKSAKDQPVIIRRPIATTTTIQAFGSGDNYALPFDLFGDDETIRVSGTVIAIDGADLALGPLELRVNNGPRIPVPLTFVGGVNSYQYDLGVLVAGDYTVTATFLRLRKTPMPAEGVEVVYLDEYEPSSATISFGAASDPIYVASSKAERIRIRAVAPEITGCPFENLKQFPNLYNVLCGLWQRVQDVKKRVRGTA